MNLDLHETIEKRHENTLNNTAYFIPYPITDIEETQYPSKSMTSLNGKWDFTFYESIQDFKQQTAQTKSEIQVPGVWNLQGYDQTQYVNIKYPIPFDPPFVPQENPCGYYQTTFTVDDIDQASILNFEGVSSAFYVFVNDQYVGYSQISHSISRFDITNYLQAGENTVSVLVMKYSDGTYFEDQDMFRHSGIFRDVYLIQRPKTDRIEDFTIQTNIDTTTQKASIHLEVETLGTPNVSMELLNPDGDMIYQENLMNQTDIDIENAQYWSAETPVLYTLRLKTDDEVIIQKIGLREIEIRDKVLYINGQSVKLRGVNHHDSHPRKGYTVSEDDLRRDMLLMKEANFNAIRTAHYPKAPIFYELADELGFYVVSEADIETHGVVMLYGDENIQDFNLIADDPIYQDVIVDRVESSIIPLKNYASIVMWSLGNESGYGVNMERAAQIARAIDPTRLLHYEGAFYAKGGEDFSQLDVISRMYPSPEEVKNLYLDNPEVTQPFMLCEYAHAMGNSPGGLDAYHALLESYPSFIGAFVWEWCDHAIDINNDVNHPKYRYGGDFREDLHDGNFCVDGIVSPDREPHEGFYEFRQVNRPIILKQHDHTTFTFKNRLDFLNADEIFEVHAIIRNQQNEVEEIVISLPKMPPHQEVEIDLTNYLPSQSLEEIVNIRFEYRHKDNGQLHGHDEVQYPLEKLIQHETPMQKRDGLKVEVTEKDVKVSNQYVEYTFDSATGMLNSVKKDGNQYLMQPTDVTIWRAPTDNDMYVKGEWEEMGYRHTKVRAYSQDIRENDAVTLTFEISLVHTHVPKILMGFIQWIIYPDGKVHTKLSVDKNMRMPFLPRLGLVFSLQDNFEDVTYLGNGPFSNYSDKHLASYFGEFNTTVEDNFEMHIKPQETGNHTNTYRVNVQSPKQNVLVTSNDAFNFNVKHYSDEQLTQTKHKDELEKEAITYLHIDVNQSGIGTNSCGPELPEKYRMNEPHYELEFDISFN